MELIKNIIFFIFLLICSISLMVVGFYEGYKEKEKEHNINNININDNIHNFNTIDSIKYNIKFKDSIVLKIKQVCKYEIEQVNNINDSSAIIMFKELAESE